MRTVVNAVHMSCHVAVNAKIPPTAGMGTLEGLFTSMTAHMRYRAGAPVEAFVAAPTTVPGEQGRLRRLVVAPPAFALDVVVARWRRPVGVGHRVTVLRIRAVMMSGICVDGRAPSVVLLALRAFYVEI